ncbi:MAG: TIM barrel protein [Candidatus Hydrogenedentota bacterium]
MNTMTRRDFLKVAGVSTATAGLMMAGLPTVDAYAPYGDLRMGIQSYSLRHFSFEEALKRTNELGLKHIELFSGHLDHNTATPQQIKDAKSRMSDLDITPDAYGVSPFSRDEGADRKIFDFGAELGLISLSADPTKSAFDTLDKLVDEYKIPIAIHNHGPNHHWGKPEVILDAIKDHHKLIGLCADTGHFLRADVDPIKAIKILRGRVFGLHVKDFVSEHKEVIAGDGKLDIKALVKELKKQKFKGTCSIEYENNPEDPMEDIRKGMQNVANAVAAVG